MSTQELLTYLFDALALGFLAIAAIDFGTRAVAFYNQVGSLWIPGSYERRQPRRDERSALPRLRVL